MQGMPGEYFWNCLDLAQPLKRPLQLVIFLKDFSKNGGKMRKQKDHAGGTATCRGPPANIFRIVCILCSHSKGSPHIMDIGYFSYFLSHYLLDKETQRDTYLNPCSEFILNFLDIIYSQMTPFRKQLFLLRLEPLSFRLCLIQ